MSRFIKLIWASSDRKLHAALRAVSGKWSTKHEAVKNLRTRLLELQNSRCVYCQVTIEADENGHREIDHILPKSPSPKCTEAVGKSNDDAKRYSTLGYSSFMYEPKNLAVCCKQCNTLKANYDSLKNRAQPRPLARYPRSSSFLWVHPHFHNYQDHIFIDDCFLFNPLTEPGKRVISVCGLDKASVLERKFLARARARAKSVHGIKKKIDYLLLSVEALTFSRTHAEDALAAQCKISKQESKQLFDLVEAARTTAQIEKATRACLAVETRQKGR